MTGHTKSTANNDLVKVAYVDNESEAELVQGLLRNADVGSVVRRAPGFDVPEFLAAGPREVLVTVSDVAVARDVLREVDQGASSPSPPSGTDRPTRVRAAVLIAVALVAAVVCVVADLVIGVALIGVVVLLTVGVLV